MGKFKDLTGLKFGRLTVLSKGKTHRQPNGKTTIYWNCICDCGNSEIIEVRGDMLKSNKTLSCGCYHKEKCKEIFTGNQYRKKYNTYDLSGDYGIGYTLKGEPFYFDKEDYDKIKDYCWSININGYVVSTEKRKTIYFHRLLFDNLKSHIIEQIDHINVNSKNDNRKYNLRICTPSQNSMNVKLRSDNSTNHTGVYRYKPSNKWVAKICVNQKSIHLGYFDNINDAIKAREEAEQKYFGKYSFNNSNNILYQNTQEGFNE